jgi:hypothetical protein
MRESLRTKLHLSLAWCRAEASPSCYGKKCIERVPEAAMSQNQLVATYQIAPIVCLRVPRGGTISQLLWTEMHSTSAGSR